MTGTARNGLRLFLTSTSLLFVELMLIRWIPANVTYIGFFSNFLLMASFLGIGLGILAGRNGRRVSILPFALLLFIVVVVIVQKQLNVQVRSSNELFFGLAESQQADVNFYVLPFVVGARDRADGVARDAARSAAQEHAAAARVRHRHLRLADRHRGLHDPVGGRDDSARLVRGRGGRSCC